MKEILKKRTKQFALRIIKLADKIPKNNAGNIIAKQILRCGTSVAANYRASCRVRSQADFISKMGIVEEEADETLFWLELLVESELVKENLLQDLIKETDEPVAIFTALGKTAKINKNQPAK